MLAKAGQPNLKLNMMILKEPGPWKREAEVLQQGFKKAGINATIQPLPGGAVVRPAVHEAQPRRHRRQRRHACRSRGR